MGVLLADPPAPGVQSDDRDASASAASAIMGGHTPSHLGALVKLVQVVVVVVVMMMMLMLMMMMLMMIMIMMIAHKDTAVAHVQRSSNC